MPFFSIFLDSISKTKHSSVDPNSQKIKIYRTVWKCISCILHRHVYHDSTLTCNLRCVHGFYMYSFHSVVTTLLPYREWIPTLIDTFRMSVSILGHQAALRETILCTFTIYIITHYFEKIEYN